jgi:NHL repeat-containing protein
MRPLKSTLALVATGAAVLSAPLAGAPTPKPRLISSPAAHVGVRWTGMVAAGNRPVVVARLRGSRQPIAVERMRSGRYRLHALFRAPGRWTLTAGRHRLGSVLVRPAPVRLMNALDVAVEPTGSLLVADFSNRVFRLSGDRLTLLAGNGRAGRSGDGGPAVRAAVGFPVEVAVDPRGGFAIVHDERWIRHVDPSGTIRTIGEFRQPTALAYDSAGNLFVSELLGGVRRRDASTGALTTYTGFNQPHGLAVAADGAVYVADAFNNRVQRISPHGTITTLAAGLNQPNDVALGPDGNLYATAYGSNRILRITPAGVVTEIADAAGPSSVASAPTGPSTSRNGIEAPSGKCEPQPSRRSSPHKPEPPGLQLWCRAAVRRSRPGTASRHRPSPCARSAGNATGSEPCFRFPAAGSSSQDGAGWTSSRCGRPDRSSRASRALRHSASAAARASRTPSTRSAATRRPVRSGRRAGNRRSSTGSIRSPAKPERFSG